MDGDSDLMQMRYFKQHSSIYCCFKLYSECFLFARTQKLFNIVHSDLTSIDIGAGDV